MASKFSELRTQAIELLRRFPEVNRRMLIARRKALAREGGYPTWREIVAADAARWQAALSAADGGKVLIATSIGSHLAAMQMETVLACALTLRGARVDALLCDALLPGCQMCEPRLFPSVDRLAKHGPQKDLCGHCHDPAAALYADLGLRAHRYSDTLTPEEAAEAARLAAHIPVAEIDDYVFQGLNIGEHAKAGALRFFARATIDGEPRGEDILRRYLYAALLTAMSVRRLLRRERYDVAVFHHGIYVPQGVIGEVARQEKVRVVNWNPAYRRNCFIFSHHDTYHHTLMDEPVNTWEDMPWPPEKDQQIRDYLKSRWQGENDWIRFHQNPYFEKDRILADVGCDAGKPIVLCLTNVMWDAQLHYPANAFGNMLEWLLSTIRYFEKRSDLQLVIRVHPAEIRGAVPSRQPVVEEVQRHFPRLPPNVFLVPPESNVSTYVLAELSDTAIIYGTKTGVEMTSMGIPVIVAGEAWIRNKGITLDATSPQGYEALLDGLPLRQRLTGSVVTRARKYAYHFFFRRMIPVRVFEPSDGAPPYRFEGSLQDLAPGSDAGLDCVCEGILNAGPFVFDGT